MAVEAGYHPGLARLGAGWQPFYEIVEGLGFEVSLAYPLKVKLIAESRIKTDTIPTGSCRGDATTLAHLLRLDYLPTAYVPPREVRDRREILRHRAMLVKTQTAVKNRIHALLAKNGIRHRFSDLFGKAGGQYAQRYVKLRTIVLRILSTSSGL